MADITVRQPLAGKHESLTVTNAVKTLTAANYSYESTTSIAKDNAEVALITIETDQIRYTLDGTTPTVAVGHLASPGDTITLEGFDSIRLFKAFRVTTDATIKVTYFGG